MYTGGAEVGWGIVSASGDASSAMRSRDGRGVRRGRERTRGRRGEEEDGDDRPLSGEGAPRGEEGVEETGEDMDDDMDELLQVSRR